MITPEDAKAAAEVSDLRDVNPAVELAELIRVGQNLLEGAPLTTSPPPDGLLGFKGEYGFFICEKCAGRIVARGCNLQALAPLPHWSNRGPAPDCSLCTSPPPRPPVRLSPDLFAQIEDQLHRTQIALRCLNEAMEAGNSFLGEAKAMVECFEAINRQINADNP